MPNLATATPLNNPPSPFVSNILNIARIDITTAQALTLGSVGMNILPPVTGYTYLIDWNVFIKTAGPAFTGASFVQPQWAASTPVAMANILSAGVIDQTTESSGASKGTINNVTNDGAAQIGSKGVRLSTNGGVDWGGTGSPCIYICAYWLLPTKVASVAFTS